MASLYNKITKLSVVSMILICSCNIETTQNTQIDKSSVSSIKSNKEIKGKIELSEFKADFSVKAKLDFATSATVSLIYPSDYPDINLKDSTVATGLTDVNGNFRINPDYNPETNQVMILESSKRYKGVGYPSVSMRTNLRWNGENWESITGEEILINKKTTAISLISSLEPNILSSNETINRIFYINNKANINYTSKLTPVIYKKYYDNVNVDMINLIDPVKFYSNNRNMANISSIKANMHTFQTILETYSVDWNGMYPYNVQLLEQEATERKYWNKLKNPFLSLNSIIENLPAILDVSEYNSTKQTLNFRGKTLDSISELMGLTIYHPYDPSRYTGSSDPTLTGYNLYGIGFDGEYITEKDVVFTLSNG